MPRFGAPWNPGWENPPKTLTLCLVGPWGGGGGAGAARPGPPPPAPRRPAPAGARPERDTAVAQQGLCRRGKSFY